MKKAIRKIVKLREESLTSTSCRLYSRILRDLIKEDFTHREEEEQNGFRA